MAERSLFWTSGAGDGHAYSQDELRLIWRMLLRNPGANEGVFAGRLNGLAVTSPGNNQMTVDTGWAYVDGTFYEHDDDQTLNVTSPSTGTTGKRVVLRKSWSARTVRVAIISSADGTAAIPALTQTDGATWEIPLASFTITTGGVIGSLTDERELMPDGLGNLMDVDLSGAVAGNALIYDGTDWVAGAGGLKPYGDGSDGDVTIASNTDLTRDMYYDTLTVNAGVTLDTDGYRIVCRTACIVNGTIANLAGEGGTTLSYLGAPTGSLGGGGNGAVFVLTTDRCGGGGGGVVVIITPSLTGSGTIHADGANGYSTGSGSGSSGIAAGTVTPPAASVGGVQAVKDIICATRGRSLDGTTFTGGSGGGISNNGTGSAAQNITNALGGTGGAATAGSGGAGGGGGAVITVTQVPPALTLTIRAAGGLKAAGGTSNNGSPGSTVALLVAA